jgi:hypothetical protein
VRIRAGQAEAALAGALPADDEPESELDGDEDADEDEEAEDEEAEDEESFPAGALDFAEARLSVR